MFRLVCSFITTGYLTYLLTYLLTYSMKQSPSWEVNILSASQEILRILLTPKVHYRIHKCPPPSLFWASSNQSTSPHPTSWRSILILSPIYAWVPKWCLSLRFPHQNPVYTSRLPHTRYMPRPSHSSRFYHTNNWISHRKIYIDTWVFALNMYSSQR